MQNFIKIFHIVQKMGPVSLFPNLDFDQWQNASVCAVPTGHFIGFAVLWLIYEWGTVFRKYASLMVKTNFDVWFSRFWDFIPKQIQKKNETVKQSIKTNFLSQHRRLAHPGKCTKQEILQATNDTMNCEGPFEKFNWIWKEVGLLLWINAFRSLQLNQSYIKWTLSLATGTCSFLADDLCSP